MKKLFTLFILLSLIISTKAQDASYTFTNAWNPTGDAGTSTGAYYRGIVCDRSTGKAWSGRVYATDSKSGQQKIWYWEKSLWDNAATYVEPSGSFGATTPSGSNWATVSPYGLTLDVDGIVYVFEYGTKKIHAFPQDGSAAFTIKASDGLADHIIAKTCRYVHSTGSYATGNLRFYLVATGGTNGEVFRISQSGVASENKFTEEVLFTETNDGDVNYAALGSSTGDTIYVSSNGTGTDKKGLVKYVKTGSTWAPAANWPNINFTIHDINFTGDDEYGIMIAVPGSRAFKVYRTWDGALIGGVNFGKANEALAVGGVTSYDGKTFFASGSTGTISYLEKITSNKEVKIPVVEPPAVLLFEEEFDYANAELLTAHGWTGHSGGTTNAISVTSPGLTYAGYTPITGNAASLTTSGQDVNKKFTETSSGSLYASFLVNVSSAQTAGDYFFHFAPTDIATNIFMARTFVKLASNGKLAFGLSKTSTGGSTGVLPVYGDSVYNTGETYLMVLKYQFNSGDKDDSVYLFINPVTNIEPTPTLKHGAAAASFVDPGNLGSVALRQGTGTNAPNLKIDGIRMSTAWNSVVPVELLSFRSNIVANNVKLNWETATETNNMGFEVYRNDQKIKFVPGYGTTSEKKAYSYEDKALAAGKYSYRLVQVDYNGMKETVGNIEVVINTTPAEFSLNQNYPNPFNPSTLIAFNLPVDAKVNLKIRNVLGEEIAELVNSTLGSGLHQVEFNASKFNSGIYFYTLEVSGVDGSNFSGTKKMMLIK